MNHSHIEPESPPGITISGMASRAAAVEICASVPEKKRSQRRGLEFLTAFLGALRAILCALEAPEKEMQRKNYCSEST